MTSFSIRGQGMLALIGLLASAILLVGVSRAEALVTTTLEEGDSGTNVTELQTFLKSDSTVYPEGLVTGYYGSLTVAAVERFQCKYSIVCSGDAASTGYGRVGPTTLAKVQLLQGSGTTGGADVSAPILSKPLVATTSASATIQWSTNEPATSRVMYGTTWPFLYASAPSMMASSGYSTNASATLSGLYPNTTYFYVLESIDSSGNLQWGIGNSFHTNQ